MKIVCTSDWHGDWVTHGVPRFEEIREAVHYSADVAIEEGAGAYVFAGDLCDPDTGSSVFKVIALAVEVARRLAERNIRSFWVAGNHDVIEDGTGNTTLTPLAHLRDERVCVFERPGVGVARHRIDVDEYRNIAFFGLPFAATSHAYDVEDEVRTRKLGDRRDVVVVAHLTVPGVAPGEETTDMARGREVVLPTEACLEKGATVINGHYHRRQRTKEGVWIPGSLARLTFNEEGHHPSFLVLDV